MLVRCKTPKKSEVNKAIYKKEMRPNLNIQNTQNTNRRKVIVKVLVFKKLI